MNVARAFATVGGLRTHFWHAGSGPTLLMLHGQLPGSCVAVEWGEHVTRFAEAGFSVYAPDLAGFGQTDDLRDHAIDKRLAHVRAFVEHIAPQRYSIWGCSMGTYLGCSMALEDPRVHKLVIMPSTILPPPLPDGAPSAVPAKGSVADIAQKAGATLEGTRTVLQRVLANHEVLTDDLVRLFHENWSRNVAAEEGRRKAGRREPLYPKLVALRNPALLLWGADESLPERALLLQRLITGAELHVLPKAAHWPQIDQPQRTFEIVSEFLRR